MAQKIMIDSGILIESGQTAVWYQSQPNWNPAYNSCTDTGQTFSGDPSEIWFYIPSQDLFYQSAPNYHAVLSALETIFFPARWSEVLADLLEQGIDRVLNCCDWPGVRSIISRCLAKTYISAQEETDMLAMLVGM